MPESGEAKRDDRCVWDGPTCMSNNTRPQMIFTGGLRILRVTTKICRLHLTEFSVIEQDLQRPYFAKSLDGSRCFGVVLSKSPNLLGRKSHEHDNK